MKPDSPVLPRCPWCKTRATVRRPSFGGGWIAGCDNPAYASGPDGCIVHPQTLPMTTRYAAARAWRQIKPRHVALAEFEKTERAERDQWNGNPDDAW